MKTTSVSTGSSNWTSATPAAGRKHSSSRSTRTTSRADPASVVRPLGEAIEPYRASAGRGPATFTGLVVNVRTNSMLVDRERTAAAQRPINDRMTHFRRGHVERA